MPPLTGVPGASDTRREYAIDDEDTAIGAPFQRSPSPLEISVNKSKNATFQQYLSNLDRRLDRIMAAVPIEEAGCEQHDQTIANLAHLFA